VARLAGPTGGYIVKRMPDTGSQHAPDCPSCEPPPQFSGLGQVLGSAIHRRPDQWRDDAETGFCDVQDPLAVRGHGNELVSAQLVCRKRLPRKLGQGWAAQRLERCT